MEVPLLSEEEHEEDGHLQDDMAVANDLLSGMGCFDPSK